LVGTFATAHRNLGLAYSRVKGDLPRAVAHLEKAVACDPADPRLFSELDELYDLSDVAPQKRLDVLSGNHVVVAGRDDSLAREIVLLVELGQYDRAIELLEGHHFHVWEGGGAIHGVYVDAHLLRGQKAMTEGKTDRALLDFRAALEYPENLEVGRPASGGRDAEVYYFVGTALDARGETELAREAFERLVRLAREKLEKSPAMDYFAKFGEKESAQRRQANLHFLLGLGLRGLGKDAEAKAEFEKALKLYPHFSRVRRQLQ